jgi:hypothetical protein
MISRDQKSLFPTLWTDAAPVWMGFLIHSTLATMGAMLLVLAASVLLSVIGLGGHILDLLTLGPSFLLPIVSGLALGYAFGRRYYSRAAGWVWLIPAIVLALVLIVSLANVYTHADTWRNMFGPESNCTSMCLGQILYSAPFLSSLAYTIGLKLRRRRAP